MKVLAITNTSSTSSRAPFLKNRCCLSNRRAPRYLEAKIRSIRKPSPDRVDPRDAYAGEVGGFELEHLDYPAN